MIRVFTNHTWRTDNNFKLTSMFIKFLLVSMLLSYSLLSFAHQTDTTQSKLVGKWLLVKHLITEGGRTTNEVTANENYTYNFAANGTYSITYTNKKNESSTTYKGKWKLTNAGKTLFLYNNTLPTDPKQLVADKNLPITKLSATDFVTKELLFAMDMKGTSYYKKQ